MRRRASIWAAANGFDIRLANIDKENRTEIAFLVSDNYTFAAVFGYGDDDFDSLKEVATKYFNSNIGQNTKNILMKTKAMLSIFQSKLKDWRAGAWAETGNNKIYINPSYATSHQFRNKGMFSGYSHAPLDAILAHEVGHATFNIIDEQSTVNLYENPYRREMGYPLRGLYDDFILGH